MNYLFPLTKSISLVHFIKIVAKVLLHTRTEQLKYGLTTTPLAVTKHIFTEPDSEFDSYLQAPYLQLGTPTWSSSETGDVSSDDGSTEMPATVALSDVIKSLVYFISSRFIYFALKKIKVELYLTVKFSLDLVSHYGAMKILLLKFGACEVPSNWMYLFNMYAECSANLCRTHIWKNGKNLEFSVCFIKF